MRLQSPSVWSLLAGLSAVQAQYLVNELSFGFGPRIAPEGTTHVPNFSIQGTRTPEILANKVILTPVSPGNVRGAVWGERTLDYREWVADIDFRVNSPDRGGGNLNVWLAKDGPSAVGSASIYTVGRFEGLALVIDQSGDHGGMIRGFLNDGHTDYKSQQVDGLSFGHCNYAYRNLGRPSQLKITQTADKFSVSVDSYPCFDSDAITLPTGYRFGVTAASADNPDSVEVFKLVVMTQALDAQQAGSGHGSTHNNQQQQQQRQPPVPPMRFSRSGQSEHQPHGGSSEDDESYEADLPDEEAGHITSSKAQFADLHNRLQSVNHHLSTIFRSVAQQGQIDETRHEENQRALGELKGLLSKLDRIGDLEQRIAGLERDLRAVRTDVANTMRNAEHSIKSHVSDHHSTLAETVRGAAPGHGRLIFVILGSQVLLAVAFVVYKRRRAASPKKYL
ncbi:uncharacterized protein E0L32_005517 [Thyridium curvatum]|uniref:L-type lectin-like domain-containing protein n=1 Tax=Thyridium curvatum TaxID=1093900 RepID=A0A507BBC0_9PEZI|nr:uncharacterized protein E0L32_005517 [Thyridium curvatum]TPX14321.1 hypothetical protein E0L32_005517 [Thyridium curvatum]